MNNEISQESVDFLLDLPTREAAKGGKDRFANGRNFLATDKVPDTIFGIPVAKADGEWTEEDKAFFKEHPEAGGYYSMGDEEEEEQGTSMKGDIDGGVSRLFDHLKLSEGLRLEAYEDPGDHKPAIAFGAHRIDGKPVYYGQKIDEATALRSLSDDVGIRAERLRKLFPKSWNLMDEGTKMALIDVSFGKDDVLSDRPGRSPGLHADLRRAGSDRAKIRSAVMKHYPSYRKSDDPKTLNGLQNRRIMGMKTFFGQDFSYDNKVWDSKLGFVERRK